MSDNANPTNHDSHRRLAIGICDGVGYGAFVGYLAALACIGHGWLSPTVVVYGLVPLGMIGGGVIAARWLR